MYSYCTYATNKTVHISGRLNQNTCHFVLQFRFHTEFQGSIRIHQRPLLHLQMFILMHTIKLLYFFIFDIFYLDLRFDINKNTLWMGKFLFLDT
ncbi:hypothetical protein RJT34_23242 [Clitoria ternatea]|uniref:Uncharacterized protein n=1 Tax=Clitoria ternatea TaxID=43366 RepID=A0AAN9FKQ1_CLITE